MDSLVFRERPDLHQPFLVMAFGGWADAAEAATRGINHLIRQLKAKRLAEMDCEDFFNYTQSRPLVVADDGALAQIKMPSIDFFYWKNPDGGNDIVLMRGVEPEFRWKKFSSTVIDFAREICVSRIYALGALYDNLPHTRVPKISGLVNTVGLKKLLVDNNLNLVAYRGPAAIHSLLLAECSKARIEMVTLWGHPPFYVRPEASPRVCMALLTALNRLLGITVDLEDLKLASTQTDHVLDRLVADNPKLRTHLKELELQYDSDAAADREGHGLEEVIRDVEDYLRNEGGKGS